MLNITVVVCTHSLENYSNLKAALASISEQTYPPGEIIVVVDGNAVLYKKIIAEYGSRDTTRVILLEKNMGISAARNAGIREAKGDVIAFIDDDAVAGKDWLKELSRVYRDYQAIAAGGKILPDWTKGPGPDYFPEELFWLVGVTNTGFADEKIVEVRNTFGPNMSFRKEVFQKAGLFSSVFGFSGVSLVQAEEPEMALRMKKHFGRGVIYNPGAIVYHKINSSKVRIGVLIKRAFFQGYSKALLKKTEIVKDPLKTENDYLRFLLFKRIPMRLFKLNHITDIKKGLVLIVVVIGVGAGYIYGCLKRGATSQPEPNTEGA
ncbi:MAG: glycosyltransferase [Dehalococcoidales bacterium]|nr:glycosyltransferase [Dehalococcoidales bacterium]